MGSRSSELKCSCHFAGDFWLMDCRYHDLVLNRGTGAPCGHKAIVLPAINLLSLCGPVTDSQGLQQLGVNPLGNLQSLRRLERTNRFAAAGANHTVN
jgi:hypothetical protein